MKRLACRLLGLQTGHSELQRRLACVQKVTGFYWCQAEILQRFYCASHDETGARSSWMVMIRNHWFDIEGVSISLFLKAHTDYCVRLWDDHQLHRIRPRTAPTQPNILAGVIFEGETAHADALVGYWCPLAITRSGAYSVRAEQPKIAKSDILKMMGL